MCLLSLYSILQKLEINIPPEVLKISSDICNKVLQKIWNYKILGKKYFPQNLKLADIAPIFKKKDPTLAKNYRPVSVLPSASKVFEQIIQKQLSAHTKCFLSPYLCGYRKGIGTQFAIWRKYLDIRDIPGEF